ncbi:hypothetical protein BD311DRAFT_675047 [Dichomitus squalens]|uniref:Uncharacterized protein n=1 Tax=Dichomitus squalens TaxID=114155 RepID=A0A4Q9MB85_9APHY|nr:hypothetical protein BD311DRAFT_675047 [Dichomitus squalens]
MGQAQNNIAFENTQTPVLFIDEACDESDRWDGGKTIHLTMTRRFEFQASPALLQQSLSHALPTPSQPIVDAPPERATDAPELDQDVVYKDGFYVYTNEVDEPVAQLSSASNEEHAKSTALSDVCSLLLENAPTEICALIRARESRVPVNVILSRGARIAAFAFPDGCGCAYLGFFFITKIGVTRSPYSLGANAEESCIYGTMSWTLDLDWTPGGEDPDALVASNCLPWWMQDHSKASEHDVDPMRSEPGETILIDNSGVPLQHPYTLLPLHFLAPSSRMGGDIKGWHCGTCGRLNVQHNLCTQRCGSCSVSLRLPFRAVLFRTLGYVRRR